MAEKSRTFRKDPDATLDYGFDWSDWLQAGETISTSVWTVGTGLTEGEDEMSTSITKIWLSGGTAGETYTVSNKITTDQSRTDERSFEIIVEER